MCMAPTSGHFAHKQSDASLDVMRRLRWNDIWAPTGSPTASSLLMCPRMDLWTRFPMRNGTRKRPGMQCTVRSARHLKCRMSICRARTMFHISLEGYFLEHCCPADRPWHHMRKTWHKRVGLELRIASHEHCEAGKQPIHRPEQFEMPESEQQRQAQLEAIEGEVSYLGRWSPSAARTWHMVRARRCRHMVLVACSRNACVHA